MKPLVPLLIAVLVTAWVPISVATAQDDGASRNREFELQTRIYELKNIELYGAFDALQSIYKTRHIAMLEEKKALVVRDTPAVLDQIAQLFEEMERLPPDVAPGRETAQVVRLQNRDPDQIAIMLSEMFHNTRIRSDFDSRQLVLKGNNAAEIKEIVSMIASLDVQADYARKGARGKTFSITVDLIAATVGAKAGGELPENLHGVAAALRKQGLGNMSVYGHMMVRTQEGEEFDTKGVVRSGQPSVPASYVGLQGTAELAGDSAEIRVESHLNLPIPQKQVDLSGETQTSYRLEDFGLSTTTTVRLGDYLVLGAMPASTEDSDTILMVIRVTTD
jgi:hypothetical protein